MARLPNSLSIALWLTGSLWIVGLIAYLGDATGYLVAATLIAGLIAGGLELSTATRRERR
jgi:hypothetical protein